MFAISGFQLVESETAEWDSDDEFGDLESAVSRAREWIVDHPHGRVDVIEISGRSATLVRVVTDGGVETIELTPSPSVGSRFRAWCARPPQVHAIGPLLLLAFIWLAVWPDHHDRLPAAANRVIGIVGGLFLGVSYALACARSLRTRRSAR